MVKLPAQKLKQSAPRFFVLKNLFDTIKKVLFGQKKKTAQPLNIKSRILDGGG